MILARRLTVSGTVLSVCLGLLITDDGLGATLCVPSVYPTINAALDAATAGDSVLVAAGRYTVPETRVIDIGGGLPVTATSMAFLKDGVVLVSEEGPAATILDLSDATIVGRGWVVVGGLMPSDDTVVDGFTITGSPVGDNGLRIQDSGRLTVRNCVFVDLDAGDGGGGAICSTWTDLELEGCEFRNCRAGSGGAVYQNGYDFLMDSCSVDDCSSTSSPVYVRGSPFSGGHTAVVRNSEFRNNSGDGFGGAVSISGEGYIEATVEDCWFEGNQAPGGGGLNISMAYGMATVERNVFWNNHSVASDAMGGGAVLSASHVYVTGNTFHACSQVATYCGGAALVVGASRYVWIDNSIFSANVGSQAVWRGPGVETLTTSCNVFWANVDGNASGFELDQSDRIVDPLYCDPENGDLTLAANSPCLPENSGACGLIGALGQGCGGISIEPESWGRIKSRYYSFGGKGITRGAK
jgi:hypothetical protein